MNIGKDWKIESDNLNVKLFHRLKRTSRDGKKYDFWDVHGYFATPKEALHELVKQKIRDSELKDIETIIEKINELHKLIDGLPLQPLPKRARQAREILKGETNGKVPAGNKTLCPKCGCNIEALKEMLKSELWEDRQAAWSIIESCESCKEAIKGGKTKVAREETLECDTCVSLLFYEWDENKRRHCLPRCIRFFRDANDVKHPCPDYSKKKKLGGGNDKKDY